MLFVAANVALFVIEGLHDPRRAGRALGVLAVATLGYVVTRGRAVGRSDRSVTIASNAN